MEEREVLFFYFVPDTTRVVITIHEISDLVIITNVVLTVKTKCIVTHTVLNAMRGAAFQCV
jgi:hypothetical protein